MSWSFMSTLLRSGSKFEFDRYFQISWGVFSLGSNENSGFVLWAKWNSSTELSETSLDASSI